MKIAFIYSTGRLLRLNKVRAGEAAREFFYGGIELGESGHDVDFFEVDDEYSQTSSLGRKVMRRIIWLLRKGYFPPRVSAGLIEQLWNLRSKLENYDVVVATTSGIAFTLGLLKFFGQPVPPIVAIHCGILNHERNWFGKKLTGYLLRRMWTQLFGAAELEGVSHLFDVTSDKVAVNQFGVDSRFWAPSSIEEDDYIFSIGNDGRRDYDLLMMAAKQVEIPFVIVTIREIKAEIPPNVKIVSGHWHSEKLTDEVLRDLYRKARCVVIPLKESLQPSGQSACLQAMACGKPVVLTRTSGLWSETMMRDNENVVFATPPGDVDSLAHTLKSLYTDAERLKRIGQNARETVCKHGTIDRFAKQIENACDVAVSGKKFTSESPKRWLKK